MLEAAALTFDTGCQWTGTFVKQAQQGHRGISFHLAPNIMVNCLPPKPAMPGPLGTVIIERRSDRGCLPQSVHARRLGTTILLSAEDFDCQ